MKLKGINQNILDHDPKPEELKKLFEDGEMKLAGPPLLLSRTLNH